MILGLVWWGPFSGKRHFAAFPTVGLCWPTLQCANLQSSRLLIKDFFLRSDDSLGPHCPRSRLPQSMQSEAVFFDGLAFTHWRRRRYTADSLMGRTLLPSFLPGNSLRAAESAALESDSDGYYCVWARRWRCAR